MVAFADEIVQQSGLNEQKFKIKVVLMMYEAHLMTIKQAAVFVGISSYEMQHEIGLSNIPIRWEEEFSRKKGARKVGQLKGFVTYMDIRVLGILPNHVRMVGTLPLHHHDPFDRMIIVQAKAENCTGITRDALFEAYDVAILW